MSFNDSMGGVLRASEYIRGQGEVGAERKDRNQQRSLASQYYSGQVAPEQAQRFMGDVAKAGGDAESYRKDAFTRAGQHAAMLVDAPEQMKPQAYAQLAREMHGLGFQVPLQYDPQALPMIQKFAQQHGGQTAETFSNAGNGYIVGNRGTTRQIPGYQQASKSRVRPVMVPDGNGGQVMRLYDPDTQSFAEPDFEGQDEQAPAPSNVQFDFAPGTSPAVMAATRAYAAADSQSAPAPQSAGPRMGYKPPTAKTAAGEYEQLSPAEVKAMGLPEGTVAQRGPNGKVDIVNKPRDLPGAQAQVIDNADGTQTVIPAGKTTEDQNKAAGYAVRMEKSLADIARYEEKDPDANRPGLAVAALEAVPDSLANYAKSEGRQNVEAAQLDALDAALTLNTGAAYTKEQLRSLAKSYFPQPGNSADVVKEKKGRLESLIQTARLRARGALPTTKAADGTRPTGADADARLPHLDGSGPQKVSTQAEFDALASGATYISTDGKEYRKP